MFADTQGSKRDLCWRFFACREISCSNFLQTSLYSKPNKYIMIVINLIESRWKLVRQSQSPSQESGAWVITHSWLAAQCVPFSEDPAFKVFGNRVRHQNFVSTLIKPLIFYLAWSKNIHLSLNTHLKLKKKNNHKCLLFSLRLFLPFVCRILKAWSNKFIQDCRYLKYMLNHC